jgi:methionine synthase I (cobalamin-dependent)
LNAAAVRAARDGAGETAFLMGSVGPARIRTASAASRPGEAASTEEVRESYRVQLAALIDAGVEGIAIETMTELEEACLAVETARSLSREIVISAMMVLDAEGGVRALSGESAPVCARELERSGADLIGVNCGRGPASLLPAMVALRGATDLPLAVRPSAGLPQGSGGRLVYPENPDDFAERMMAFLEIGVSIVGGCCGTTPDHIRALARRLEG